MAAVRRDATNGHAKDGDGGPAGAIKPTRPLM
jgi:hypothetical protein